MCHTHERRRNDHTHPTPPPELVGTLAMLPERHKMVIEAYGKACAANAYQAGTTIDLAGHKFEGRNLIERVMRNMTGSNRYGRERWAIVKDTFAVGSTVAHALCHEFGLDPDGVLRK